MILTEPALTRADRIVLQTLLRDSQTLQQRPTEASDGILQAQGEDNESVQFLSDLSNPNHSSCQPAIFPSWNRERFPPSLNKYILQPYISHVRSVLKSPFDVVFISYILVLFTVGLPSALLLFLRFNWIHAILHWVMIVLVLGPYSVISHNQMHGRGIMSPPWAWFDVIFPYLLGPIMGQTWNGFYYHHKHHHIEDNGPDDLSSTLRYQRDSALDLAAYIGRMIFLIWLELPLYYLGKGKAVIAMKFLAWELASYALMVLLARVNFSATMVVLVLPFFEWRAAVMANNWGQHVFIDEVEPTSDFRSSIVIIGVVPNRDGFNDGYHTSHHLKPSRHWSDHPRAFIAAKESYAKEGALIFRNMDFIKLTVLLLFKRYDHVAECLVPMGDQIGQSQSELASMLRRKTRRFTEEMIQEKFPKKRRITTTYFS